MKTLFKKHCKYCNDEFESYNFRKTYCSNTCKTYASHRRNGKLNDAQIFINNNKTTEKELLDYKLENNALIQKLWNNFIRYEFEENRGLCKFVEIIDFDKIVLRSTNYEMINSFTKKYQGGKIEFREVLKKNKTILIYSSIFSIEILTSSYLDR